jgi:tRNASer (uridine44-2'-O)-methyltransferase
MLTTSNTVSEVLTKDGYRCGNGLLTHILSSEGYVGTGIDLRARYSWPSFPRSTQDNLKVHALDPTSFDLGKQGENEDTDDFAFFTPGVFIIGNHADELTPWVPVLSTLHNASGYLSIPCCPWIFDAKFERSRHTPYPLPPQMSHPSGHETNTDMTEFVEGLHLGGHGSNESAYSSYRIWLASLSAYCGWKVETESLRIPSTRNWALIGVHFLE